MSEKIVVSAVIPVFNEENNLPELNERLNKVMEGHGRAWEVIYIDDGSVDDTPAILEMFHNRDKRAKVIFLSRNFGQHAAVAAGFDSAKGDYVITIDADLQNNPEDIPLILEKLYEGYNYVSGWRVGRKDPFSRKLFSFLFNRMANVILGTRFHDIGCALKGFDRSIVVQMKNYGAKRRFAPALAVKLSNKVTEVKVNHNQRLSGQTKYSFLKLVKLTFNFLFNFLPFLGETKAAVDSQNQKEIFYEIRKVLD